MRQNELTPQDSKRLQPIKTCGLLGLVGFSLCLFFQPLYAIEVAILIAIFLLPFAAAGFWFIKRKAVSFRNWSSTWQAFVTVTPLMLLLIGMVFMVNVVFDRSPTLPKTFPIELTHHSLFSKHTHYFASFRSQEKPPIPFVLSELESVQILFHDFSRVSPGKSSISLGFHHGFLGFAWYEDNYQLLP